MANPSGPSLLPSRMALFLVALLGAIEGIYGRNQYLGDWISYLNVSQAVSSFDLKAIFDPMWAPGYPILIALVRAPFPHSALAEWYAIPLLNFLLYLALYAAWRALIRQAIATCNVGLLGRENRPVPLILTTAIFLAFSLCFDQVSRVAPDLLVTLLFLLACAQTLRLLSRPTARNAFLFGAILAAGIWTKGVFIAYAALFLLTLLLLALRRQLRWPSLALATAAFLAILAPFAALTSWAYGSFTLGVTGALNYAFHVNHLPHWTNWQGGPPALGTPLHPTTQLVPGQPAFGFAQPFHTTYPAYNNMAWYYQGYRHFFTLHNQLAATARTAHAFLYILRSHPILYALIVALGAVLIVPSWRASLRHTVRPLWFLFLPPVLGLATYLLVHVEDRYLTPILLIPALIPLLPLLHAQLSTRRHLAAFLLAVFTLGSLGELAAHQRHTFIDALHHHDFRRDEHWQIASAMPALGLHPGDPIAVIVDERNSIRCSWAYMARLRIVAEFGSVALPLPPPDHYPFDPIDDSTYGVNYVDLFRKLPASQQAQILAAFQNQGAKAVLAYRQPEANPGPRWSPIPNTTAWLYRF